MDKYLKRRMSSAHQYAIWDALLDARFYCTPFHTRVYDNCVEFVGLLAASSTRLPTIPWPPSDQPRHNSGNRIETAMSIESRPTTWCSDRLGRPSLVMIWERAWRPPSLLPGTIAGLCRSMTSRKCSTTNYCDLSMMMVIRRLSIGSALSGSSSTGFHCFPASNNTQFEFVLVEKLETRYANQ